MYPSVSNCVLCENETRNGILLPKLFWPDVRKNCSSDQEKLLKFVAEGQELFEITKAITKKNFDIENWL